MNRSELNEAALSIFPESKNVLLSFATGVGKSKTSLDMYRTVMGKCLIAVNEKTHIQNWKNDIIKHGNQDLLKNIEFTCHASIHKYSENEYNVIILDEAHNCQSPKRLDALKKIKFNKCILLTATITQRELLNLEDSIGKIYNFKYSLKQAVKSEVLPKPKINLIELSLNEKDLDQSIVISRGLEANRKHISVKYSENWKKFISMYKDIHLSIICTELEKYDYLCNQIDYYQMQYYTTRNLLIKNKWMQFATQRKRFLSGLKTEHVKKVIDKYDKRFICFAGSIIQCNQLGGRNNVVHSKIKNPSKIIEKFNSKLINQLFVVDMLREGENLVDANVIIVQLDSKNRSALQMLGRSLRHSDPVIHIFYYKNTQDEIYLKNSLEEFSEFVV
jgi:superfamily II DNA or RNA helicase